MGVGWRGHEGCVIGWETIGRPPPSMPVAGCDREGRGRAGLIVGEGG